jgi:ADP-ribose pyrophosphatase YjhB (NUDIX family)
VDIILQKGLEVLLVKRRNEPLKGYFALPGGLVKEREKVRSHKKEAS